MTGRIDQADIDRAMAVSLADIADERGLKLTRASKTSLESEGKCPRCGGTDRFSINDGKAVFNCRACGGKGRGAIAFVRWLDDCGFREAVETLIGERRAPGRSSAVADLPAKKSADDDERSLRFALDIWRTSASADATPIAAYLARRGLTLPSPDVIRFHPRCPFGKDAGGQTIYTPAMIALVRNIVSNEPQAIHRTALDLDGNKVEFIGPNGKPRDRMILGSMKGGAVKLTGDADVTIAVGIGEGIETTLRLQLLPEWLGSPVWSLLSKQGIRDFPVMSGIETLVIAVDHDEKRDGQRAATEVVARWRAAGREVLLAFPTKPDSDINDVIRERAL